MPAAATWTLLAGLLLAPGGLLAQGCGPHVAALYPYARFYYEDPAHRPSGMDKDMFDKLARRSGCTLRQVVESRVRIWDQMRRGVAQLTLSALSTPERREVAEFVFYAQGRYQALMRRELAARVRSIAAFEASPGLRLLTVRAYAHGPQIDAWVQRMRAQGRLLETGDFKTALRMMRAGRADALLVLPSGWHGAAAEAFDEDGDLVSVDVAPGERNLIGLALALGMPEADRLRLRHAMQAMLADGTVLEIMRRHLGDKAAREVFYSGDEARASSMASP
jgi:polar amino acid transport system substrate-binding protein